MKTVKVRNLIIGEGIPKICASIVGSNYDEVLSEISAIENAPVDMIEWRADFFEGIFEENLVGQTLSLLRKSVGEMPIIFTFRTSAQGGEKHIDEEKYVKLNEGIIKSQMIDIVDIETSITDSMFLNLVEAAKSYNVKVIGSHHDFQRTPTKEEIINILRRLQTLNVHIPKIAVMANSKDDGLTLLKATNEMSEQYANGPIITVSMGENGVLSRFSGELLGSSITYGSLNKKSAPGQMGVGDLNEILRCVHKLA